MYSLTRTYKIYKDRFLLSLAIALIFHSLVVWCFFLLPTPEKRVILRPISLGVLQTKAPHSSSDITTPPQPTQKHQKPIQKAQKNKKQVQKITPTQPKNTREITPSQPQIPTENLPTENSSPATNATSDINFQTLETPAQQTEFNPFVVKQPSLAQTLQQKQTNTQFEKLPKSLQDELYKLYGTQLDHMSKEEKDYLSESYFLNGEVFQQTADRIGYPRLAAALKQQGNGVIEFTLYPDGHVENIKIIESTTFDALDDSLREVVELSAKNLKRPPQPITIRLRGNYTMQER